MTTVVGGQWSVVSWFGRICFVLAASCLVACSVPNLEPLECKEARDKVKQFYSSYFDTHAAKGAPASELFDEHVTGSFKERRPNSNVDPFVLTNDFPKAFRVGECKVVQREKRTEFEVLLFWRDDVRSEQRSIKVETENVDGKWLIREVSH